MGGIMSQRADSKIAKLPFDLKQIVHKNRLVGVWRMMKGFRWFYVGTVMCMAIGAGGRALNYEVLTKGLMVDQLYLFGVAFVGIAVMQGFFSYLQGTWAARTAEGITLRLRNYLFDHIQRLPFKYHDHAKTGELIQRVTSDVDALRRFYADQAIGIGRMLCCCA
jgi:ATP-binding cassette subfamily B protein